MQRIDAPWLAELQARIEAGEFDTGEPDTDVGMEDRPEIGYAIGRRAGRGQAFEFWDAASGRWNYGKRIAGNEDGWTILRRELPGEYTQYHEEEHAEVMAKQVDETGTAVVFAVLLPAPKVVGKTRRARVA